MVERVENAIEFIVHGHPEPGGSKQAQPVARKRPDGSVQYIHDARGRPLVNVADANPRAKAWKRQIAKTVGAAYGAELLSGPLIVSLEFYLHRWKSHYGTGKNEKLLKASAPLFPGGDHPDALKLARPVEDALTGVLWEDDALTVDLLSRKRYVPGYCLKGMPGEHVVIRVMQHEHATVGERAAAAQGSLLPA